MEAAMCNLRYQECTENGLMLIVLSHPQRSNFKEKKQVKSVWLEHKLYTIKKLRTEEGEVIGARCEGLKCSLVAMERQQRVILGWLNVCPLDIQLHMQGPLRNLLIIKLSMMLTRVGIVESIECWKQTNKENN